MHYESLDGKLFSWNGSEREISHLITLSRKIFCPKFLLFYKPPFRDFTAGVLLVTDNRENICCDKMIGLRPENFKPFKKDFKII